MTSVVVDTAGRALSPFILIYGAYLTIFGSMTIGGGFQGGVLLASGVILVLVTHGREQVIELAEDIGWFETFGALFFLFVGILGLLLGGAFLKNIVPGTVLMPLLLDIVISLKVFAGFVALFIYIFSLGVEAS